MAVEEPQNEPMTPGTLHMEAAAYIQSTAAKWTRDLGGGG